MPLHLTSMPVNFLSDLLKELSGAGYRSIALTLVDDCEVYDCAVIEPSGIFHHGLPELSLEDGRDYSEMMHDIARGLAEAEEGDYSGEWLIDLVAGTITHFSTAYTEATLVSNRLPQPDVTRLPWASQSDASFDETESAS